MAEREGGGTKVFRGMFIALGIIVVLVLLVVLWAQFRHGIAETWGYVVDHFPKSGNQRIAVIVYLVLAALGAVLFSNAGHFTAYGIATGLGTLLWVLFWEGFPPLGLHPNWTGNMGLGHLDPTRVILWAVVGFLVITIVFVPLELSEKYRRRRHSLAKEE